MKYNCEICNKQHVIYFGMKAEASQTLGEIIKYEDTRVEELEKDYFFVDKSIVVIPAILEIQTESDILFTYETWVEINWDKFSRMADDFKNSKGSKIQGKLYDDLVPYYTESKGTNCIVEFLPNSIDKDRARITILDDSQLKLDQKNGISEVRLLELMNLIYHNPNAK